jgi:zinc/manganese transport system substrate-binding protein
MRLEAVAENFMGKAHMLFYNKMEDRHGQGKMRMRNGGFTFPWWRRMAVCLVLAMPASAPLEAAEKLRLVASFSILADLAREVGGAGIDVASIVGPNGDAHVYEPKPDDVKQLSKADLVIVNGLGFEGWIGRLVATSGFKGKIASLGNAAGLELIAGDPHAWQNIANATIYVNAIALALCDSDPGQCAAYHANATRYGQELAALDGNLASSFAEIPAHRRIVITSHEAFGYFAKAYHIRFAAPVGITTDSEASAREVAMLIRQIRKEKVGALFVENLSDPRLMAQVAAETGVVLGGNLYSDSLSQADGPASTYVTMMKHNAALMLKAMTAP